MFVRPSDVVPKKLSIWPSAMMIAMPDVKPIMTGIGMKLMSRPSRSTPAMSSNTPAAKHAKNTPCSPCAATMPTSTALIAPVGPEIWNDAPPSSAITIPATMAVTRPAAAEAPDETPTASASGSATAHTVRPARMSFTSFAAL